MRKVSLALVGPRDSVELILEVAAEYEEKFYSVPCIYEDASEVPAIIRRYDAEIDLWIFSGKVPYQYAVESKLATKPLLFVSHTGTSIYRVFLQLLKEKSTIGSMSFDTFSRKEIAETFADAQIVLPELFVNDYSGIVSASELTRFHYELWQAGKTTAAVTCFYATYLELKRQGVKAFRIWPTKNNIRAILNLAISKADAIFSKAGQIAIQQVAIDEYDDFSREAESGYSVLKVELQLHEYLLSLTEKVQGSIVMHGNGRFTIFSTRGAMEEITRGFKFMPGTVELCRRFSVGVSGGLGFGDTAYAANENATIAMGLARRKGKNTWMVVLDDKTVIGPLNSDLSLNYSMRSETQEARGLAKRLNISGMTLNRLLSVFAKIDGATLGAETLAKYLSMTERNARRLLGNLSEQGMAVEIALETPGAGRPRKIYRLDLAKIRKL